MHNRGRERERERERERTVPNFVKEKNAFHPSAVKPSMLTELLIFVRSKKLSKFILPRS